MFFSPVIWHIATLIVPLLVSIAYLTLLERKQIAAIQGRKGPNIVGIFGLLQPLADGLKLFAKEMIIPNKADICLFILAPILTFALSLISWAILPIASLALNVELGILFILVISSLAVYGIIIAGWSSNSNYALLGALRSAAQMISYEVSIGLLFIPLILFISSLNFEELIAYQKSIWNLFHLLPVFILFFISALAETNRAPFDLPEAEAELVAGYNVEYSGMAFALFFLGEYNNMIVICVLMALLFLGGWFAPITYKIILTDYFIWNHYFLSFMPNLIFNLFFFLIVVTFLKNLIETYKYTLIFLKFTYSLFFLVTAVVLMQSLSPLDFLGETFIYKYDHIYHYNRIMNYIHTVTMVFIILGCAIGIMFIHKLVTMFLDYMTIQDAIDTYSIAPLVLYHTYTVEPEENDGWDIVDLRSLNFELFQVFLAVWIFTMVPYFVNDIDRPIFNMNQMVTLNKVFIHNKHTAGDTLILFDSLNHRISVEDARGEIIQENHLHYKRYVMETLEDRLRHNRHCLRSGTNDPLNSIIKSLNSKTFLYKESNYSLIYSFCYFFILPIKVFFLLYLFILTRAAVPRYRYDQLMQIGWKMILPISLVFVTYYSWYIYYFTQAEIWF